MSALERMEEKYEQLSRRLSNTRAKAEQQARKYLHTAEVGAAGLALGFAEGRGTSVSVFGLNTEETAAGALLAASLLVDDEDFGDHLRAFGEGSLAVALNRKGVTLGEQSRSTTTPADNNGAP